MSLPMSLSCAYAQWPMAYGLSDLLTSLEVLCKLSRAQAGQGEGKKARRRSTSDVPCMPYHIKHHIRCHVQYHVSFSSSNAS